MRVFVDESGDTGFKFDKDSSRYFAVTLVIFENQEEEDEVNRRIGALRQELRMPKIEFHFAKNKIETRKAFLSAIKGVDFSAVVCVADKTRIAPSEFKDSAVFYNFICGSAFERAKPLLREASVQFDDGGGKRFKRELGAYLRKRINTEHTMHIKNVGALQSASSDLIQVADMIGGAVYRSFQGGVDADVYRDMIKHRLNAVYLWPD